jgi:hypothetical protein
MALTQSDTNTAQRDTSASQERQRGKGQRGGASVCLSVLRSSQLPSVAIPAPAEEEGEDGPD